MVRLTFSLQAQDFFLLFEMVCTDNTYRTKYEQINMVVLWIFYTKGKTC